MGGSCVSDPLESGTHLSEWDPLVWVLWVPVTSHVLITISVSFCNANREMFRAENKAAKVALEQSKQVFRVEELQDQQKRWSTATSCKFSFRVLWTDIDNATQDFYWSWGLTFRLRSDYLLVHRLTEQLEDLEGQLSAPPENSGSHEEWNCSWTCNSVCIKVSVGDRTLCIPRIISVTLCYTECSVCRNHKLAVWEWDSVWEWDYVAWEWDFTSGIQSQLATLCEDYDNAVCAISEALSQCQGIWPPLLHYSPLVSWISDLVPLTSWIC